jgi:hypothetical protein
VDLIIENRDIEFRRKNRKEVHIISMKFIFSVNDQFDPFHSCLCLANPLHSSMTDSISIILLLKPLSLCKVPTGYLAVFYLKVFLLGGIVLTKTLKSMAR